MRNMTWGAAALVFAAGGCFAQSGGGTDPTHTKAALTLIDSLAAFADIEQNVNTDPAAAGDALTRFVKAPAAAVALLGRPFDSASPLAFGTNAAPLTGVPDCLTTSGEVGCGSFTTTSQCEAGNFTFSGTGSQQCNACDATGTCDYAWDLQLGFDAGGIAIDMYTTADHVTVTPQDFTAHSHFEFTLTAPDGTQTPASIGITTCTPLTFDPSCDGGKTPTGGSVVVDTEAAIHALPNANLGLSPCAHVQVTGCGQVTVDDACTCGGGEVSP